MTQHLSARPIGSGDPIFTPADSTLLKPAECDFRADDVNVTIRLNHQIQKLIWTVGSLITIHARRAPLTVRASDSRGTE